MNEPRENLQDPPAEDPMPFAIPFLVGGNFISPGFYINETLKTLIGVDAFGWASQQIAGDWEAVKRAAGAAERLAHFNTAFHDSLEAAWGEQVEASWRGNAADDARAYFSQLAGSVEFQVRSLEEIHRTLNNISNSMVNLARVLGDLLQDLFDAVVMYLLARAAGAVMASSLATSPLAMAQFAVAAAHAVYIVARFGDGLNKVTAAFKVVIGLGATLLTASSRMPDELPPLSTSTYDHPGV